MEASLRHLPIERDELALWHALRNGADAGARSRLLDMHLPYARVVAATYYARRTHDEVEFADYLQLARLGVLESIDRFDPGQGAQFRTFAARRMHGVILDGLEKSSEKSQQAAARKRVLQERLDAAKVSARERKPGAKGACADLFHYLAEVGVGLALGVLLEGSGMIDADAYETSAVCSNEDTLLARQEHTRLQAILRQSLNQLNPQEQAVIRRHYLQGHAFDDIATHLCLSKGRISQIHKAAMQRLRSSFSVAPGLDFTL